MTNTIPNVARTMKKCAACRTEKPVSEMKTCMHNQMHNYVCDSKYMHDFYNPPKTKVAPSPAGVDGLEVVAYLAKTTANGRTTTRAALGPVSIVGLRYSSEDQSATIDSDEPLCRISDAQAIIDGLRGENERIRLNIAEYNESIACYQSERDQQAQRIGELEGLLLEVHDTYRAAIHWEDLRGTMKRIAAALSAGKDSDQ